ncbi:ribonuclease R [Clostridium sp. CAG:354]|jgi:ribonuclease R|nr:ribonuclease R [Clostridium sp.]MEE0268761.1 ribonuclease R [Clostridia bacterium]CDE10384.1 ribonuclease R [Clostridium sp. CAG:354]
MQEENRFIEGIFRRHERGFGFVIVEDQEDDIYIAKEDSKDAFSGDRVLVKLKKKSNGARQEGIILKVIEHKKDTLVGTFQKNKNFGFVIPDDKKLCRDIFISKKNFGKARNNHKVLVQITKYPQKGKKAEGKILEVIGNVNEAGIDMLSLIKDYDLPYRFPKDVVKEAQKFGDKINPNDIAGRVDLRSKYDIFTIDGEDAKDLDDAVCVQKLENGNYKLDVHIADVSHYVQENTLLDKEALLRGTSIYMLNRVIPMLPRELSNGICSLNEGQDRYTLSVSMEIDNKGKIISSEVYKGIINVTRRMSYKDVQAILDNSNEEIVTKYKDYIADFKLMEELAKILKEKRITKGYLNLDIPESKIILDQDGYAIDVCKYETTFANEIIEQFMLAANETIAEKFYWLKAPFIYRVHEEPDIEKVNELNKLLFNFGYKIHVKEGKIYPAEFSKILKEVEGKPEEKIVSNMILRTLKVAVYDSENKGHFGIASKYYCHFTSPIRRYPDLFIHRIISKYLKYDYTMSEKQVEFYNKVAENDAKQSSDREKIATQVERNSIDIKKAEYMSKKIGEQYEGIISGVTQFGVFVELENTVEGLIRFENLGDEYYEYDADHKILIGERTKETFKIGDKINIEVIDANKQEKRISFKRIQEVGQEESL